MFCGSLMRKKADHDRAQLRRGTASLLGVVHLEAPASITAALDEAIATINRLEEANVSAVLALR